MIVTDKFIFIHQPKTGGTFVVNALAELYDLKDKLKHDLPENTEHREFHFFNNKYGRFVIKGKKHSLCDEIEKQDLQERLILGNTRNPLDLYVSQYEFGWWKRKEYNQYYDTVKNFKTKYPGFPDLRFEEYLKLDYETFNWFFNDGLFGKDGFGMSTVRFIKFYCRNQDKLLQKLSRINWSTFDLKSELYSIHFIRTNNLNDGLFNFLVNIGFEIEDVQFIIDKNRTLPLGKGRSKEQKWKKYYTPELLETVLKKDKLLFDLFPEFIPKSL